MRSPIFLILMMLMVVSAAVAGPIPQFTYGFTVIPDPPVANQPFQMRVTLSALSCYTLPDALTISQPAADVIQYELRMVDGCLPLPEQQRSYAVPAIAPGQYTLRLAICVAPPAQLPTAPCGEVAQQVVVVAVAAPPSVIPAVSSVGVAVLTGIAMLLGFAALLRRG